MLKLDSKRDYSPVNVNLDVKPEDYPNMALEQEVAALRDEIQKLTAVTTKLLETRVEAIETVRAAAAPEKKAAPKAEKPKEEAPKEEAPKTEKQPAPKEEAPKEEAPKAEKQPLSSPLADDDFTDAGLKTHVSQYVNLGGSEATPITKEEREARMAKVRETLAHEKIQAATVAEVPEKLRKAFRKKINDYMAEIKENGWLTAAAEDGASAEEEDDL